MYRHQYVDEKIVNDGIKKVILNLIIGVFISFITMFCVYNFEVFFTLLEKYTNNFLVIAFIFPIFFTFTINKINMRFIKSIVSIYFVLTGLLLTYALLKYGSTLLILSVFIASIIFILMSAFAYFTSEDLERERVLLKISLFFLIITYLINMYFGVYILHWILAYWALITFIGLVAYDFQHIKKELSEASIRNDSFERISLTGVLQFYLNFLILSLILLNIFGKILV